jgi:hypothetical protein
MSKPLIFISCGQYSQAEKDLGNQIAELIRELTACEPFFAEQVHDLNGLDENILSALHKCVGLIAVLHPRGRDLYLENRETRSADHGFQTHRSWA